MEMRSFSSSYGRSVHHVSYKVKYCHRIFDWYPAVRKKCEKIFFEVARNKDVGLLELGFDGDHVHMVIAIRPTHSLAEVAKWFKGTTARKLLQEFPQVKKKHFWGSGLWGRQHYFDSLGRENGEVSNYVRNQGVLAF